MIAKSVWQVLDLRHISSPIRYSDVLERYRTVFERVKWKDEERDKVIPQLSNVTIDSDRLPDRTDELQELLKWLVATKNSS